MATFSKLSLAPGGTQTNGLGIRVASITAGSGTPIHSCSTTTGVIDEIWLYAYNGHTTAVTLTFQWGGTTSPDNDIRLTLPSQSGLTLVVPGLLLRSVGAAVTITAYTSVINVVVVRGYINRIT